MSKYSAASKLVTAAQKLVHVQKHAKGIAEKDVEPVWDAVVEETRDLAHDAATLNKAVESKNTKKTEAALYLVLKDLASVLKALGSEEASKEVDDAGKTFLQR